jgi:uncharacterized iron-regulated protein
MKRTSAGLAAFALMIALSGDPIASWASDTHPLCAAAHDGAGKPASPVDICAAVETAHSAGNPRRRRPDEAIRSIVDRADGADFVLLGEIHDNPAHHRVRSQIILSMAARRIAAKRTPPGLVLEHIRADQDLAVIAFRAVDRVQRRTADDLFKALDWPRSGWPSEEIFRSLFEAAIDVEWPILHGNVTRADIRAVAREGLAALDRQRAEPLGLSRALPETVRSGLLDEIEASHCGLIPRAGLITMVDAQVYRDAYMASRLIDAAETHHAAVLLAGNGHVRRDRAVPLHLARLAPGKRTVIVMLAEVDPERTDALAYLASGADDRPTADYVVVTPRVDRPDPCIEMKKRFTARPKAGEKKP